MPPQNQPASTEALFREFTLRGLRLANRIVMAPMTRNFSPGGVPGADVAAMVARDEIDLVAVGRALIANPAWPDITRRGAFGELAPFDNDDCNATLY